MTTSNKPYFDNRITTGNVLMGLAMLIPFFVWMASQDSENRETRLRFERNEQMMDRDYQAVTEEIDAVETRVVLQLAAIERRIGTQVEALQSAVQSDIRELRAAIINRPPVGSAAPDAR